MAAVLQTAAPARDGSPSDVRFASRRGDVWLAAGVMAWIGSVLSLDSVSGLLAQRLLGIATWGLLLVLLRREPVRVRAQVAVVVLFASAIEYTFSGMLHVYVYRLHNVPWFVPPGHGLVYLGALAFGRSAFARAHARVLIAVTLAVGGAYAAYGVLLASRVDALGVFWFGCLALFLWRGRLPTVFVGAFAIVTYLELLGTGLGDWTWQLHDFTGIVPIGNPPSGAAGGYGFFDAAALAAAPWIEARLTGWRAQRARRRAGARWSSPRSRPPASECPPGR